MKRSAEPKGQPNVYFSGSDTEAYDAQSSFRYPVKTVGKPLAEISKETGAPLNRVRVTLLKRGIAEYRFLEAHRDQVEAFAIERGILDKEQLVDAIMKDWLEHRSHLKAKGSKK